LLHSDGRSIIIGKVRRVNQTDDDWEVEAAMMRLLVSRLIFGTTREAGPLSLVVPRVASRARKGRSVMTQSRFTVFCSLLMAGIALALLVKVSLAAQAPVPNKPAGGLERIDDPAVVNDQRKDGPPMPDPLTKLLDQIISKKPVMTGPVDDELRSLLLARRDAAVRRVKALGRDYEQGSITVDRYIDGFFMVIDAQVELTDNAAEHVRLLELRLELAKEIEAREAAELEVGRGTNADVEQARYRRLSVEIDLLRTKRKVAKK
jgi:hypothetical protein